MEGKWIYLVLLLAYYAWSAYSSQKKKREEQLNKKQSPTTPKRHYNPTPASGNIPKPLGDLFKNILGDEILSKPVKKPYPKKDVRQPIERIKPAVTVFEEGKPSTVPEKIKAIQHEELISPQQQISFNAREAFIGSIIWNKPEY